MAVIKKVVDKRKGPPGKEVKSITQPVITYTNDGLAAAIIDLWDNVGSIYDDVIARDGDGAPTNQAVSKATAFINGKTGMKLERAVIITEDEHDNDWVMQGDEEVVFVVPDDDRVASGATAQERLETAKMLMACTPNGI